MGVHAGIGAGNRGQRVHCSTLKGAAARQVHIRTPPKHAASNKGGLVVGCHGGAPAGCSDCSCGSRWGPMSDRGCRERVMGARSKGCRRAMAPKHVRCSCAAVCGSRAQAPRRRQPVKPTACWSPPRLPVGTVRGSIRAAGILPCARHAAVQQLRQRVDILGGGADGGHHLRHERGGGQRGWSKGEAAGQHWLVAQ